MDFKQIRYSELANEMFIKYVYLIGSFLEHLDFKCKKPGNDSDEFFSITGIFYEFVDK
jgi:hypothetical protein